MDGLVDYEKSMNGSALLIVGYLEYQQQPDIWKGTCSPACEIKSNGAIIGDSVWSSCGQEEKENRRRLKTKLYGNSLVLTLNFELRMLTDWKVAFPSVKSRVP